VVDQTEKPTNETKMDWAGININKPVSKRARRSDPSAVQDDSPSVATPKDGHFIELSVEDPDKTGRKCS